MRSAFDAVAQVSPGSQTPAPALDAGGRPTGARGSGRGAAARHAPHQTAPSTQRAPERTHPGLRFADDVTHAATSAPISAPRESIAIPEPDPPDPQPFAPLAEHELDALLRSDDYTADDLDELGSNHPRYWLPITMLAAAMRYAGGDVSESVRRQLRILFDHAADAATHPFFATHLAPASRVVLPIAPGVSAEMPFGRDSVGLMLADVLQRDGGLDRAIDVVERITPGVHTMLCLAELYLRADRNGDVVRLTNGVTNDDDATAMLLVYRGVACTRIAMFTAARTAFTAALARRNRAPQIRRLALRQRAELHAATGDGTAARRDLARILAEDGDAPGVRERSAELRAR